MLIDSATQETEVNHFEIAWATIETPTSKNRKSSMEC